MGERVVKSKRVGPQRAGWPSVVQLGKLSRT